MDQSEINITDNYKDLCEKVTQEILDLFNKRIELQGRFTLVLSGGSTPRGIYECMANPPFRDKFQWEKIHFFWSDERWVAYEDEKSNYRMVSQALFSKVSIPSQNIHPIQTMQIDIKDSARLYEEAICDFFKLKKNDLPRFDLILLGLGGDGHIASIFPGNPVFLLRDSLVASVTQQGIEEQRITMTLPVINQADTVFIIISGHEKAKIVAEVLEKKNKNVLPIDNVKPNQGRLSWFLDKAAAGKLANINTPRRPKRIGIAADHGGYQLKEQLSRLLREASYEVIDFGNHELNADDDFPDFVVPLARAVSSKQVDRGVAICGSGVGACIASNKVPGVRACLIHEEFSACQGVEDDDMNVICLGSRVLEEEFAWKLIKIFLSSQFNNADRHLRRLAKVAKLEHP